MESGKTSAMMGRFYLVLSVTGLNIPNTGNDDDNFSCQVTVE
jgi:hypothetical protein